MIQHGYRERQAEKEQEIRDNQDKVKAILNQIDDAENTFRSKGVERTET